MSVKDIVCCPRPGCYKHLGGKAVIDFCCPLCGQEVYPKYRTLVRIVDQYPDQTIVTLPGWNWRINLSLVRDELPKFVAEAGEGFRCYAYVRLGTDDVEELGFERWEEESKNG